MHRMLAAAMAAIAFLVLGAHPGSAQQAPNRALIPVADNLYRFQNNFHFGVVYVTTEGVIVGDTISADAARWLKAEIARRFNQPVKFVVLSHDHADHASGAEVFADTATVIAHENARRAIIGEGRPTAAPPVTFSDRLSIHLGGRTVEVSYVGRNHSDNSVVMRFPSERALFAVDFVPVKGLAFRDFPDAYFPDWIELLEQVEQMSFDTLLPGHGPVGTKADVAAFRGYLEDLHDAVLAGARANKSLDQLKAEIKLEKYSGWMQYKEYLPLNIEGMYRIVSGQRRPN